LAQDYVYVLVYEAAKEAFAAENEALVASMSAAEANIEDISVNMAGPSALMKGRLATSHEPHRRDCARHGTRQPVVEAPFYSLHGEYVEDNPVERTDNPAYQANSVRSVVRRNWTALQTAGVDYFFLS
jgi:hypothetical protein